MVCLPPSTMPKAGSRCYLVVGALLGVALASASAPWRQQVSTGALDDATLAQLSQFRAQRRSEESYATEAASIPAAHAPIGERAAVAGDKFSAATSATGTGAKLMSTSQREALSARLKELKAAARDWEGKAAGRPPQKIALAGTYWAANDVTKASENGGRRNLQTCADDSGVTVTSSEFPLLEGCLEESEDFRFLNSHVEFMSATGLIVSLLPDTDATTEYWFALYGDTTAPEELLGACISAEAASTVHPSEATWLCALPDGSVDEATATTLSVDCGCDGIVDDDVTGVGSPTPTTSATSSDISATSTSPDPTTGGGCPSDESLGVTSTAYPLMEGCLAEIELEAGGELEYSSNTAVILAGAPDETTPNVEYWFAMYGEVDIVVACISEEMASTVHPSEATWGCVDADDNIGYPTGTDFVVECGCDGVVSPSPTPSTSPATTAAPIGRGLDLTPAPADSSSTSAVAPAPTSAGGTCAAGAGVSVTSSEFPQVEGCLVETDIYDNDGVEYVSATGAIFSGVPEGDVTPYWYASYGDTADPGSLTTVCQSVESSEDVHPAEATWVCLVSSDSAELATGTTFTVECGCDGLADDDGAGVVSPTPTSSTSSSPGAVGSHDGCAETSVTVTSSEFPLLEGCLIETDLFEGGEVEYVGGDAALIYADDSAGETESFWYAVYLNETSNGLVFACGSVEPTTAVHPADATWVCAVGTEVGLATPATFSVECGCDGVADDDGGGVVSPSPASTASPVATDRDFGDTGDITPAPADDGGDDGTPTTTVPIEDDTEDAEEASPGGVDSTDGAVGRSPSAWSAAAGAGATGVIAAVMTLAMGRW